MARVFWSASVLASALLSFTTGTRGKTVYHDFDIGWVNAAPDGFNRPVIGINGKWPLPTVEADVGDTIVVKATNRLGNETTGIHWHGMFQSGTNDMDGAVGVTQCAITPGDSYTYSFTANPAGTFWYHSHSSGQYPDGLRAPMIIHNRAWEKYLNIEDQYIMSVSDWYHNQMPSQINFYLSPQNQDGEPIPQSSLINDKLTETFKIKPMKRYLIRIVNMSALAAHFIKFDGHQMEIVAVDGVPVKSAMADTINISAGQRYDIVITGLKDPQKKNYGFVAAFDEDMFDNMNGVLNEFSDGVLQYDASYTKPKPVRPPFTNVFDDITLVPKDERRQLGAPGQTVTFNVQFNDYSVGSRGQIGTTPYIAQKVPALFTAITTGKDATNPKVYGDTVNPYILKPNEIVQVVINNLDNGGHPFHMHGHVFQVLERGAAQPWNNNTSKFPQTPMQRDTVKVPPNGYVVIRFQANNPGVYLFHCHIEWHIESGLTATFIEDPMGIQRIFRNGISDQQKNLCRKQKVPTEGNCAGETRNVLDTSKCVQKEQFDSNTYGSLINPPKGRRVRDLARRLTAVKAVA